MSGRARPSLVRSTSARLKPSDFNRSVYYSATREAPDESMAGRKAREEAPVPPPKPKLSLRDQLNILNRLEQGEYNRRVGIEQFLDEKSFTGSVKPPSVRKGVAQELKGAEGAEGVQGTAKGVGDHGWVAPPNKEESEDVSDSLWISMESIGGSKNKNYDEYPEYIKKMHSVLAVFTNVHNLMNEVARLQGNATFSQVFNAFEIRDTFAKMKEVTAVINGYLKRSPFVQLEMFKPLEVTKQSGEEGEGAKRNFLHCEIQNQEGLIQAIQGAGKIIAKIQNSWALEMTPDLGGRVEELRKNCESLEEKFKKRMELQKTNGELQAKLNVLCIDEKGEEKGESSTSVCEDPATPGPSQ